MAAEPIVGRHAELERIDAVVCARGALPGGLLFSGPVGMGKTVLWRDTVRRAQEHGYLVLECALSRGESRLAFAGLADLVGPVLDRVVPELAPQQGDALRAALALTAAGAPVPDERAVAFGLHGALSSLARRQPIAVAVDDTQWLDASSALMLSYALRRLRGVPVLLVLARRDGEASDRADALEEIAGFELERIEAGPLPLGAIHRLIRMRLGSSLTRPQLLRVQALSGGNPLHALELARAIEADGAPAPGGLRSLVERRVASLPGGTRRALALAGLASDTDLEALAGSYGAGLADDLAPAIDAELVVVEGGRVRFTHPLVASAAEARLPEPGRRELHLLLAAAAGSDDARALHLAQATRDPDPGVAAAVEMAARSTRRRGARAASAELFEAAALLTPPAESEPRARRLLAAAEGWHEAGDSHHPVEILSSLLAGPVAGDARCEAGWRLGILLDESGRWQEAVALWREALAGTNDPGLTARLQCSLAITAFYTESVQAAVTLASEAVGAAERSGDPACLARALAVQALTLTMSGAGGHRPILERALALEEGVEEPLGDWSPSAVAAECSRHGGDVDGARRHYAVVLDRAARSGDANVEQWAAFGLASAEILAGDFRRASELADTVLDLADQAGQMRIPARSLRAQVDALLGHLEAARAMVAEATALATNAAEATHLFGSLVVRGMVELCAGDLVAAARAHAEARRIALELGLAHATVLRAFVNETEVAATAGLLAQAEEALAAFETLVKGIPPGWSVPMLHRARASVLAARGDLREADRELGRALEAERLPLERGRTLLATGAVARRLRQHTRARAVLGEALDIFTALGSPPWMAKAERELARIPGRRASGDEGLTAAEARIAGLVAAGRPNREVAAELFVSVKTVELTLTHVYAKLGLRSRTELAARFAIGVPGGGLGGAERTEPSRD